MRSNWQVTCTWPSVRFQSWRALENAKISKKWGFCKQSFSCYFVSSPFSLTLIRSLLIPNIRYFLFAGCSAFVTVLQDWSRDAPVAWPAWSLAMIWQPSLPCGKSRSKWLHHSERTHVKHEQHTRLIYSKRWVASFPVQVQIPFMQPRRDSTKQTIQNFLFIYSTWLLPSILTETAVWYLGNGALRCFIWVSWPGGVHVDWIIIIITMEVA